MYEMLRLFSICLHPLFFFASSTRARLSPSTHTSLLPGRTQYKGSSFSYNRLVLPIIPPKERPTAFVRREPLSLGPVQSLKPFQPP